MTNEQCWHDQLAAVDPFSGDPEKLSKLLETAPGEDERSWLANQIKENKRFIASLTTEDEADAAIDAAISAGSIDALRELADCAPTPALRAKAAKALAAMMQRKKPKRDPGM